MGISSMVGSFWFAGEIIEVELAENYLTNIYAFSLEEEIIKALSAVSVYLVC